MEAEATYKVCIFGEGGVGKTTLTRRYLTGLFDDETKMTLGASIHIKYQTVEGIKVATQIWDFGGEERFKFMLPVYAHGSAGAIFMYDITRYATLKKGEEWLTFFNQGLGSSDTDVPILFVGSKLDRESERTVSAEEAVRLTRDLNFFKHIECSAKTGENIEEIFQILVKEIMQRKGVLPKTELPAPAYSEPIYSEPEPSPPIYSGPIYS